MDSTIIAAAAAVLGSVVGAAATIATTWITQRTQTARSKIEVKLRDREALYGEFITEASRLTVDGLTHQLEQPATFVKLYGILGRIRLVAADPVLASAEACCRQIVDLYAKPNMTVDQIRAAIEQGETDPIKEFSTVCRTELLEIAHEVLAVTSRGCSPAASPLSPDRIGLPLPAQEAAERQLPLREDSHPTPSRSRANNATSFALRVGVLDSFFVRLFRREYEKTPSLLP